MIDLFANELLDGSPFEHKPLEDVPFRIDNGIVESVVLLRDLENVFEDWVILVVKRGPFEGKTFWSQIDDNSWIMIHACFSWQGESGKKARGQDFSLEPLGETLLPVPSFH